MSMELLLSLSLLLSLFLLFVLVLVVAGWVSCFWYTTKANKIMISLIMTIIIIVIDIVIAISSTDVWTCHCCCLFAPKRHENHKNHSAQAKQTSNSTQAGEANSNRTTKPPLWPKTQKGNIWKIALPYRDGLGAMIVAKGLLGAAKMTVKYCDRNPTDRCRLSLSHCVKIVIAVQKVVPAMQQCGRGRTPPWPDKKKENCSNNVFHTGNRKSQDWVRLWFPTRPWQIGRHDLYGEWLANIW